ncbi:hypothetical protein [Streptomyces sp. NPDC026673]|uniref:hypothetical protein n=1 Tax=Streptomyces sp. NPDC026673 TaxID=3155724 RepID=UPI0033FCBB6D
MPGGQGRDVDSSLSEGLVDVEAELLALIGLEGAFVVGFIHRVQGQNDALHYVVTWMGSPLLPV